MSEKVICKKCGSEMSYYQEKNTCGWICPVCGDGMVTTYIEPIARDGTVYTLCLHPQSPLTESIKVLAEVLCCNYLEARKALLEGSLRVSGNARKILDMAFALKKGHVSYHIEPEFPYSIKTT